MTPTSQRHRRPLLGIIAALVLLAVSGCADQQGSAAGGSDGKSSILLNWFAQAEHGGYFAATAENLDKKNGVDITIKPGGPQIQTIPQVAAGKADFGVAQADELLLARAQGVPIVYVFAAFDTYPQCMMYHPSTGIKDFSDLNGHPIAVAPSGGFWPYLKGRYHLDNVKEVNFTGSLSTFKRKKDLVQQCFITSEPYHADQANIPHAELMVADSGYNPYSEGLFTTEQMIEEHPDLVRKVVKSAQQGYQHFLKNPKPAKKAILAANEDMEPGLVDYAYEIIKKRNMLGPPGSIGHMDAKRWSTMEQQLEKTGVLKKDLDPSKAYTNGFIPKK